MDKQERRRKKQKEKRNERNEQKSSKKNLWKRRRKTSGREKCTRNFGRQRTKIWEERGRNQRRDFDRIETSD